jgi:hypothetical protein
VTELPSRWTTYVTDTDTRAAHCQLIEMITTFEDIADLVLIEIFSYLSCADVLSAFTCLNCRITGLLAERGFFRHVDLSSMSRRQFDQLLHILPLDDIETLTIDRHASPLQLRRWPYLPRLRRLQLRGVREYDSVLMFVVIHAATLTHITIESSEYFLTVSVMTRVVRTYSNKHFSLSHRFSLINSKACRKDSTTRLLI